MSAATEPNGWYISHQNGASEGPLTDAQMRQAIGLGRLKPDDHVWREGMDAWVEARQIPNFAEVRGAYRQQNERAARMETEHRERREKSPAGKRNAARVAAGRPRPGAPRSEPQPAPRPQSSSGWDYAQPPQTPAGKTGGIDNIDLEKMLKDATDKIGKYAKTGNFGKIPPGAIVFFVLGFIFMPLLPVFWFIAWRIWANANK